MKFQRCAGILLHPSSLPGAHGIGTLGAEAMRFIDFLADAGQSIWQVLPLGPTGYGDSPYACYSAFAGNPLLIDLDDLVSEGLLEPADFEGTPEFPTHHADFNLVAPWKLGLLAKAQHRFLETRPPVLMDDYDAFKLENAAWLDDYALFMALRQENAGAEWLTWDRALVQRLPEALVKATERLASQVAAQSFIQFLFFRQWERVKKHANARGIRIMGDVPIFVAGDSVDVWAHQDLFHLDAAGRAKLVAGVPPDYFSETGQRWGNPLYNWQAMARDGYAWWIERFRATLKFVDIVRIDHFRGFDAYWEIPAEEPTAMNGRWVRGPAHSFFDALGRALGELPIVAEDLGVITAEVTKLREDYGFPGMKLLQMAFGGGADNDFLPHNFSDANCVVYTGTHDNDTTRGWYASAGDAAQDHFRRYLNVDGANAAWDMIHMAYRSTACMAIVPMQDALDLGGWARMNYPGKVGGWWSWRCEPWGIHGALAARLKAETELTYRQPNKPERKIEKIEVKAE